MTILREVVDSDLPVFFEHMQDKDAQWMAAFTHEDPSDRAAFDAHWAKIRGVESIVIRTVDVDGQVAGHIASWLDDGCRELTYWIGRDFWGKGVATATLAAYLDVVGERPLRARAAKDNPGSIRVLEKCGFKLVADERGFANARQAEIDEVVLELP